jgi:hypothetical protein
MPGTGDILFITNDPSGNGRRGTREEVMMVLAIDDTNVMVERKDGSQTMIHIRQIKDRV